MSSIKLPVPGRLERESIRMCAKTLEVRAESDSRVVVSAKFARQVARYLRQLLEVR